ncbi:MAG: hypothetical protein HC909_00290 [Blastochloris sp.]|nr:hypothetical protein [Blastochloris sp.]
MATRIPYRFRELGNNAAEGPYFPSAGVRCDAPDRANTAEHTPIPAEYSPLISVVYLSPGSNREGRQLATGIKRRNDGSRQTPKAEEFASARRAGTDPCAAWRWSRSAAGRVGSSARPSCAREVFEAQMKERRTTRS